MSHVDRDTPEPTHAERIRSLLTAAASLTLAVGGQRYELFAGHSLARGGGRLRLSVPADSDPALAAAQAPPTGASAVLELTDVAPVAVRQRIRGRLAVAGRLHPAHRADDGQFAHLWLEITQAALSTPHGSSCVDRAALAAAEADPLARYEAGLLTHLADDHPDALLTLTRLIEPGLLAGVHQVVPLALDRLGIVLRLERERTHQDVRLAFPRQVADAEEFGHAVHALLAAAHTGPTAR
ncbi:DUF2470 domain-containing protein [Kitasatospora sp. NPDC050543]|uniref:DUF2470 domain-containing protein n=1 Tax=Kitasatospora sp. NPDC050543 TaxID=3364054 RepID=UPI0037B6BB8E